MKDTIEIFRFVLFFSKMCNQVHTRKSVTEDLNGNCQQMSGAEKKDLNPANLGMNG